MRWLLWAAWLVPITAARTDYSPVIDRGDIPTHMVRSAGSGLHDGEKRYVEDREQSARAALTEFITQANVDFEPGLYSSVIGLAYSGGGYRAMLTGAGQLAALDIRTNNAENSLGGILQASTYITGLSGGSWLLGTLCFNNFSTISSILDNDNLWQLQTSPLWAPKPGPWQNGQYYCRLAQEIEQKKLAGYPVTVTDLWGRALFRQMLDTSEEDGPRLWSDLQNEDWFTSRDAPFPIVLLTGRQPPYRQANPRSPIFEVTPFEIGTFDIHPYAFANLKYLGTPIYNGIPLSTTRAISGLDNAGFIMGASSSLFDQILAGLIVKATNSNAVADLVRYVLSSFQLPELGDLAIIAPNPFFKYEDKPKQNLHRRAFDLLEKARDFRKTMNSPALYLADGGANKQAIPIQPLLQPERKVDAVFAFDNTGRNITTAYPDGSSMQYSYARQFQVGGSPAFPYVPDRQTFVESALSSRPAFFGCYAEEMRPLLEKAQQTTPPPVIIYIPNSEYSYPSNTSTFQLAYSQQEIREMVQNGYNVATQGSGAYDSDWPACVACALTQRSRERLGHAPTKKCARCFETYCWRGTPAQVADFRA